MEKKRKQYSRAEVDGIRILVREVRRAIEKTALRCPDRGTRHFCCALDNLALALLAAVDSDLPITILTATQPELPDYSTSDDYYAVDT